MTTNNQRYVTYIKSPEDIRELYESCDLITALDEVFKKNTQKTSEGILLVADTILGFYKITDLPRLFQQKLGLSADESQRMTSQLIEFLAPVVKREEEEAKAKKEGMAQLSQTFAQPPTPERLENPNIQEMSSNVAPIRTMEKDMNRIHGYGAYVEQQSEPETIISAQDDLLTKKQTPPSV